MLITSKGALIIFIANSSSKGVMQMKRFQIRLTKEIVFQKKVT